MPHQDIDLLVREIIADTLERRESGERISDEEVLAAHPDLADRLAEKLKQLALVANARELAGIESIDATISMCTDRPTTDGSQKKLDGILPGQKLRHYLLVEQIGAGGFGSVWRAKDTKLDCEVAVKIPKRELSPEDTERFIHEARVSAQLRKHPNIVSVHEADWEGGTAFIVSDFVDGDALDARLDRSRVPFNEAVDLIITVCGALHHAHSEGIIHRDLKPDNILLDGTGIPHITDFGLAKRESQIASSESRRIMGTAAYMSPEQARGESDDADCRSDVFSLGVVLFELLTGERPFRGSVQHILRRISNDDPPRPRSFDPRIPVDLETICLKCLEKDPAQRYQSASELSEDLERFRRREPIQARPVSAAGRLLRWCQRNPSIPLLSLSLMVVTIVAAWASFRFLEAEVNEMQNDLSDRAQKSLELLSKYAAHEANLNLAMRFDQVRSMNAELNPVAIRQLNEWNYSTSKQDRDASIEELVRSEGEKTPHRLREIQRALVGLKERTQDPDILERTYSLFICDHLGTQIARADKKETLGTDFSTRQYFQVWYSDAEEGQPRTPRHTEPRLSDDFVTSSGDEVIAISAPIYYDKKLQGVAGIFIKLGDLVQDPETPEANDKMLLFDARKGRDNARLIHNQGRPIPSIESFDLSPYLPSASPGNSFAQVGEHPVSGSGRWRIATRQIRLLSDTEQGGFVVMMVEEAATIENPGEQLRANLVKIGLSVVGFAALVLSVIWVIILQRVVKT